MKLLVVCLLLGVCAYAHRLDEYLQTTLISVEKSGVQAEMTLTPGIAVLPVVWAAIDRDGNGIISEGEQRDYAARVLRDVSLTVDGVRLAPRLVSAQFPSPEFLREGMGEIRIAFRADVQGAGGARKLAFQNHHFAQIAAYQVNCLVPRDRDIEVVAQTRNYVQSMYGLDYVQASGKMPAWVWAPVVLLLGRLAINSAARRGRAYVLRG